MAGELIVFVTCPKDSCENMAKTIVEEHLAACVNIVENITSIFYWQDKLCSEKESLLVIKSHEQRWNTLEGRIKELHCYETPEIIAITAVKGYKPYMDWLNNAIKLGDCN